MKSYSLKCLKKQGTVEKRYYQNLQYMVVKNYELLKIKKQKDY